ncbi:MAG TPA: hypothetical protein VLH79_03830, partial [Chthonomonadales bacterium]|nr:hypothetical protein [Chthonomonadales bacterium]
DLVSREEIKRELLRLHSAMALSLLSQFVQVGVARERAMVMVDAWFGQLRKSRFAAASAPDLLPVAATAA